jgi:hypothetical protein
MPPSLNKQITNAREELEFMKMANRKERLRHKLEMVTKKGAKSALDREYERAFEAFQSASKPHVYTDAVRDAVRDLGGEDNNAVVSTYVVNIEGQACRAVHLMGVVDKQALIQQEMYLDLLDMGKTLMNHMKHEKELCQKHYGKLHAKKRHDLAKLRLKYSTKITKQVFVVAKLEELFKPKIDTSVLSALVEEEEEDDDDEDAALAAKVPMMTMFERATSIGTVWHKFGQTRIK